MFQDRLIASHSTSHVTGPQRGLPVHTRLDIYNSQVSKDKTAGKASPKQRGLMGLATLT